MGWLEGNWFSAVQSLGIVGGLFFTAVSSRQASRSGRVSNVLALTAQHRDLWSEMHRRPDLGRIFQVEVDFLLEPMTPAEEEFLNTVFVHVNAAWELARLGPLVNLKALRSDMGHFLAHPLPRLAWQRRGGGHRSGDISLRD
jgi:hypothetical protein